MKQKTQSGFAHVGLVLLLVIVLGVVGGGGFYIWHKNHEKKNTNTSQSTSKTAKVTNYAECLKAKGSIVQDSYPAICVTKDKQSFTQPIEQKYLTIKEWGVKIPLAESVTDTDYRIDLEPIYAFMSPKSLLETDCNLEVGGSGYYVRFTEKSMDGETKHSYISEYPDATMLGGYYYGYGVNPAEEKCSSDPAVQAQADAARAIYKAALKNIQSTD